MLSTAFTILPPVALQLAALQRRVTRFRLLFKPAPLPCEAATSQPQHASCCSSRARALQEVNRSAVQRLNGKGRGGGGMAAVFIAEQSARRSDRGCVRGQAAQRESSLLHQHVHAHDVTQASCRQRDCVTCDSVIDLLACAFPEPHDITCSSMTRRLGSRIFTTAFRFHSRASPSFSS